MTHHSTIWAGLLSTVATTCAPPTDDWAHSDLTMLSACTDILREFCFMTHTRCPTASPGEGKKMSLSGNTIFQQWKCNVVPALSCLSRIEKEVEERHVLN